MLHPGDLDHLVIFEKTETGIDDAGNAYAGDWKEYCRRWCKWSELYAREKANPGALHSVNRVTLKTWQDQQVSGVTSDMRARVLQGRNKGKTGAIIFVQIETAHEIAIAIDTGETP